MDAAGNQRSQVTVDELATVRLFRGLSAEQRQRVVSDAEIVDVAPGEAIVEEGAPDTDLYVLLSGTASVSVRLDGGSRLDVGTLRAGDSFGELAALLRDRRSASVIAAEPCRLLRIGEEQLISLIEEDGHVGSRCVAASLAN